MSELRHTPVAGPSVWTAADLQADSSWTYALSSQEAADLERALDGVLQRGKSFDQIAREDFPLPTLSSNLSAWMQQLERGRGFCNVTGFPVRGHSVVEIETMLFGLGTHLGQAVSQNAAGDLLSHIRDYGVNPHDRGQRLYKTNIELGFHSDGSDLVALLCVNPSQFGGANRLASCGAIYNEILRRRADLVDLLYEPFFWDRNNEEAAGEPPFFSLPICMRSDEHFRFFYIGWYIRNAQRHEDVPRLSAAQVQLLDLIDEIAAEPNMHVEFRMEAGEINFLKNAAALHMRTAFGDTPGAERRRHMLRLWLTAHGEWADGDSFVQQGIPRKQGVSSDRDSLAINTADNTGE